MARSASHSRRWRRWAGLALRLVIAAAGLTYVATTLTWHDTVVLPPSHLQRLGIDTAERAPLRLGVTARDDASVTVRLPGGDTTTLAVASFDGPEGPVFEPGIVTTCRRAEASLLPLAALLVAPAFVLLAVRWTVLMRCRGLGVPVYRAFRLTMAGAFFNTFMPGMTGGDIVKAYYAARGSGRTATAVMSVAADRAVGLLSLVLVGSLAGVAAFGDEAARSATLKTWGLFGFVLVGILMYFSPFARRRLGISRLLGRLPEENPLRAVDRAAWAYRGHPGSLASALALSLPVHLLLIASIAVSGYALGATTPLLTFAAVLPLVLLAGSLPLSFMGFGVMEPVGIALLAGRGADPNQIVAMLVLVRVYQVLWSAGGAVYVVRGGLSLHAPEPAAEQSRGEPPSRETGIGSVDRLPRPQARCVTSDHSVSPSA